MMSTEVVDDFEVSKAVFEKLKDLPKERQERVLRWVTEGLGLAASSPRAPVGPSSDETSDRKPTAPAQSGGTDIKTFVAAKGPKSDQQFATVVAYYYRFEAPPAMKRETITTEVIQEAARLAGRARLVNPNSTLNNARNQGYLDRGERGEFKINTVGENLVAMALPGDGTAVPRQGRRGSQPKRRAKTASPKRGSKSKRR